MSAVRILCMGILAIIAGCQPPTPDPDRPPRGKGGDVEATSAADAKLLEPLLLAEKPADALSVAQVRSAARDGDSVVIKGTIPPATVYQMRQSFAEVRLMDREKLESEEVKTEFDCNHGLT